MKILIDNGHGNNTAGKRSPDGKLREYAFARKIAASVVGRLKRMGYDAELLVDELYDVSLDERVHRANVRCQSHGKDNVILISIHCNASKGPDTQWKSGNGWEAWTFLGQSESDVLAEFLYDSAEKHLPGHKIRIDSSDGDKDKESRFYILRKTLCPAVLTENLFQDNKKDVAFLLSPEGEEAIADLHVDGIVEYLKSKGISHEM